jgi:hypothetical protein
MVALSTSVVEYMTVIEAFNEGVWLHGLIENLVIFQDHVDVHCDSQSVICLTKN